MTKIRSSRSSRVRDRRGAGGGGGGFPFPLGGGGGGGLPFPTKAGGGLIGLIVVAAIFLLPRLLGSDGGSNQVTQTPGAQGEQASGGDGGVTECETELEQILCGASDDVQDYWIEQYPASFGGEAYRETDTVFFSGAVSTGCGQATAQTGPFYCPADFLVYFDLDFLTQLQEQFGATGDLAAQYIVAHEYGHHVQNLVGTNAQVREAQQSDPGRANEYSVALELQADCYAGAWTRSAADRDLLDNAEEIQEALNAAAAVGDDRIQQQTQGEVDPDSFTHGTSQQRQTWFTRGFNAGGPDDCDTFAEIL